MNQKDQREGQSFGTLYIIVLQVHFSESVLKQPLQLNDLFLPLKIILWNSDTLVKYLKGLFIPVFPER